MNKTHLLHKWNAEASPQELGSTKRTNHEECGDSRGRLYFTRPHEPGNMILYFCHNCQEGGAFKAKKLLVALRDDEKVMPKAGIKDNSEYIRTLWDRAEDLTNEDHWRGMPKVPRKWFSKRHHLALPYHNLVKWDQHTGSIVFAVDGTGVRKTFDYPETIQQRYFKSGGPKCITTKTHDHSPSHMWYDPEGCDTVVIVEDLLSMYWVYQHTPIEYTSYALLGCDMSLEQLYMVKKEGVKNVYVWLDNDNAQVIAARDKIAARASNLGFDSVKIIKRLSDPKNNTVETLCNALDYHITEVEY